MTLKLFKKADGVFRVDIGKLYPPFLEKLMNVLAACSARGADYYVTEGFRSWGRSHSLYLAFLNGGPRAAPAGFSGHNYGLAVDVTHDSDLTIPGLQPDWKADNYIILGEEVRAGGLAWGGDYKSGQPDRPHIAWPGYDSKPALAKLHDAWLAENSTADDKLQAVWDLVSQGG